MSSKSAYEHYHIGGIVFEPHKRIWKTWAPLKAKLFIWLVMWKRCWTADRLVCRRLPHPETCPFCDQAEENIQHILITCVFVRETWYRVLATIGLQNVAPTPNYKSVKDWWRRAGGRVPKEKKKGFNT